MGVSRDWCVGECINGVAFGIAPGFRLMANVLAQMCTTLSRILGTIRSTHVILKENLYWDEPCRHESGAVNLQLITKLNMRILLYCIFIESDEFISYPFGPWCFSATFAIVQVCNPSCDHVLVSVINGTPINVIHSPYIIIKCIIHICMLNWLYVLFASNYRLVMVEKKAIFYQYWHKYPSYQRIQTIG